MIDTSPTLSISLQRDKKVGYAVSNGSGYAISVETPDNSFITPVNIKVIESFMQTVGYQGVVDKVGAFYTKFLAQAWQTMFKYPRFTKLIIADLMKKFPSIPPRLEEDYHSIKDDIPLVSVYTTGNVTVRGMLIPDAFLTNEIHATDDYKEYDTVFVKVVVPMNQPQLVVEGEKDEESYADKFVASMVHDDVDDSGNRIEPESHKEHPKVVDDDDENKEEKKDEKKDDEMGSLENRTEKMQTLISTPPRSPRINLSLDKNIILELTDTDMERKCVTTDEFWKVHGKVDQVLHEIVPQLAERATNDLIESNLKPIMADTIIQERDTFQSKVPALISKEFDAQAPKIIEDLFKHYMKSSLQDQANNPALWDVLKRKFEKSSTFNTSCKDDDFHSQHHDDHQDDDAPPEGKKREWDAWVEETIIDEDEVILEDETPELITEFQNVDKQILTIFDRARMEATPNDMLSVQFRNAEEYAYHLEQATNFIENQINGNTEEKKYILSLHKIHAKPFPEADLEEKINRWVKKEFKNFNEDVRLSIQHWKDSWHKSVQAKLKKSQRQSRRLFLQSQDYRSCQNYH
ncbi:hypothetical protein Tco_0545280 [Tanacetum coccineum]